jgi:hypothetical protein
MRRLFANCELEAVNCPSAPKQSDEKGADGGRWPADFDPELLRLPAG